MTFKAQKKCSAGHMPSRKTLDSTQPNTVLIIAANKKDRFSLGKIFASSYKTIEAANGREALDLLARESNKICAMLIDLTAPAPDCTEILHELSAFDKIRVVAVTGNED